jgi:fatty acid metabolism transcriptional regulator FadR
MAFERVKRLKVAEQVVGAIRAAIVGGKYREGDSLPSERDLAAQFGVNRSSIREALLRLESWGLVHIKQGGATRVRDVFYSAGLQMLPFLIAPDGELNQQLVADVMSVRVMFLSWTAELAAENATDEDVAALHELLDKLRDAHAIATIQRLDWAFFERLVQASRNRVLGLFTNALGDIYRRNEKHLRFLYRTAEFNTRHHEATVAAIEAGDALAAGRAMRAYGEESGRVRS